MPPSQIKTEAEALADIEKDARAFLEAHHYQDELGVFSKTWEIYTQLPLDAFKDAVPREDRMVLPGMDVPIDVTNVVIQAMAGVWISLLQVPPRRAEAYSGGKLFRLVQSRGVEAGAPKDLAKKLAGFVTERFDRQGTDR